MKEFTLPCTALAAPLGAHPASNSVPGGRVLWALVALTVVGCGARLLLDEQVGDAPMSAAILLISCLVLVQSVVGVAEGLLAFLMLPALFGAAPWNSPVRAYFGLFNFPIYIFDALLVIASLLAVADALRERGSHPGHFIRGNLLTLTIVAVGIVIKVANSGVTSETLRNAALFYYFPSVFLTLALLLRKIDVARAMSAVYVRSLPLAAIAAVVIMIGIAVDARQSVLVELRGGVEPAGYLGWFPPGSLILLTFCAAAFLPDRTTRLPWKLVIVLLLFYDAATYLNRAMWFGIAGAVGVHWAMVRGWRGMVLLCTGLVLAGLLVTSTALDTARASHNESSEWRLLAWTLTGAAIVDQPLAGHTLGESLLDQVLATPESRGAAADAQIRIDAQGRSPHNSYLSLLFFGGLVQGGAVILFIARTLGSLGQSIAKLQRRGRYQPEASAAFRGAFAAAIYTAFNVVLESPVEGITFWTLLFVAWAWGEALRDQLAVKLSTVDP